jgi:hypothetical protein
MDEAATFILAKNWLKELKAKIGVYYMNGPSGQPRVHAVAFARRHSPPSIRGRL